MNIVLLLSDDFISPSRAVIKDERRKNHINLVLNVSPLDTIKIGVLNGKTGQGTIVNITQECIILDILLNSNPPPALPLTLLFALSRPKTFKKVLQAATALGIKQMVAFNTWKVDKSYWSSPVLSDESIREQFILGLEQSGDTVLPAITFHRRFKPFVEDELEKLIFGRTPLVAHPGAVNECPRVLKSPVTLCLGPEGGFTDYEIGMLEQHHMTPVTIGDHILRTEFALCVLAGRLF